MLDKFSKPEYFFLAVSTFYLVTDYSISIIVLTELFFDVLTIIVGSYFKFTTFGS